MKARRKTERASWKYFSHRMICVLLQCHSHKRQWFHSRRRRASWRPCARLLDSKLPLPPKWQVLHHPYHCFEAETAVCKTQDLHRSALSVRTVKSNPVGASNSCVLTTTVMWVSLNRMARPCLGPVPQDSRGIPRALPPATAHVTSNMSLHKLCAELHNLYLYCTLQMPRTRLF